ncbi:MAG: hypothetical protein KF711_13775 [Nitrospira sp.]|nr:hypothetical protein [Nitrospira sp.]
MSTVGIAATKDHLYLALTSTDREDFRIFQSHRIAIDPSSWPTMLANIKTHLDSYNAHDPVSGVGLVGCASGMYGASPEAFKAEGLAELQCQADDYPITRVTKQSLKKRLECQDGQTWQQAAKALFNSDKSIKHFSSGFDAAIAGAYAILT